MYKIFLLILLAGLLASCNKNPVSNENQTQIVPLAVGNFWFGAKDSLNLDGQIISSAEYGITVSDIANKSNRFLLRNSDGIEYTCANSDSGLVFYFDSGYSEPDLYLQFKYPAKNGDFYRISRDYFRRVISADTIITTKYGTYHCIHYVMTADGLYGHLDEYISPRWGYIYSESWKHDYTRNSLYLSSRVSYKPHIIN